MCGCCARACHVVFAAHRYAIVGTNLAVLLIAGVLIGREAAMDAKQQAIHRRALARQQTQNALAIQHASARLASARSMQLHASHPSPLGGSATLPVASPFTPRAPRMGFMDAISEEPGSRPGTPSRGDAAQ